jgi:hypothetical protein
MKEYERLYETAAEEFIRPTCDNKHKHRIARVTSYGLRYKFQTDNYTLKDVSMLNVSDILAIPSVGTLSVLFIEDLLKKHGLHLGMTEKEYQQMDGALYARLDVKGMDCVRTLIHDITLTEDHLTLMACWASREDLDVVHIVNNIESKEICDALQWLYDSIRKIKQERNNLKADNKCLVKENAEYEAEIERLNNKIAILESNNG